VLALAGRLSWSRQRRTHVRFIQDPAEVDEVIAQAKAAGAAVTGPPHDRPWGIYSGYFQDPDDHLWEIIWNPALAPVPS
jgi:uncharacterized protein